MCRDRRPIYLEQREEGKKYRRGICWRCIQADDAPGNGIRVMREDGTEIDW